MSKIFLTDPQTGKTYPGDEQTVTNLLRENAALIRTIKELQNDVQQRMNHQQELLSNTGLLLFSISHKCTYFYFQHQ
ncbi:unnamed protein product [Adineta ricciae]|uniref:Uncharacterized protein n=1 Tax=Adineta ricciae TaxID=249248 RepID=A0A814G5V9_ADIRI|nr:unnamed protein product [Adineta ricciae]